MLKSASAKWAKFELYCSACFAFAVTLLILLNVITRTMGAALFWVDELAIYAMVWMTFLGTSAALHYRQSVAVTIFTDLLSPKLRRLVAKFVDLLILIFSLLMVWFCWRWFSPLALLQTGFDFEVFQGTTFNFIYAEPTSTLGIKKYLVWMIMWIFSLGATLHSLAHFLGTSPENFHETQPETANKSDTK